VHTSVRPIVLQPLRSSPTAALLLLKPLKPKVLPVARCMASIHSSPQFQPTSPTVRFHTRHCFRISSPAQSDSVPTATFEKPRLASQKKKGIPTSARHLTAIEITNLRHSFASPRGWLNSSGPHPPLLRRSSGTFDNAGTQRNLTAAARPFACSARGPVALSGFRLRGSRETPSASSRSALHPTPPRIPLLRLSLGNVAGKGVYLVHCRQ
jgi:hypothetical protein